MTFSAEFNLLYPHPNPIENGNCIRCRAEAGMLVISRTIMVENLLNDPHPSTVSGGQRVRDFVDFGEDALAADDLRELLQAAVRNVARGLGAEHAKILRRLDDDNLLVVAGVGWAEGVVGNALLDGDINSPPGFALKTGEPVRSNNFGTESRFKVPQLLVDHKIKSAINVIIRGDGLPFGVLEVDSTDIREFDAGDTDFLQGYAQLLSAAILRVKLTEDLTAKSQENAFLLRELHHRIGNDFQLVMSLINFRAKRNISDDSKAELSWVSTRIKSLAHLHDQLRKANSSSTVDLAAYLVGLCEDLESVHNLKDRSIQLNMELSPWSVGSTDAVSIGLIVNEFMTNSIEHAFPNSGGVLSVVLEIKADQAILRLADDGPGFEPAENSMRSGMGLMLQLADSVSTKVLKETENGMHLQMHLNPPDFASSGKE